MGIRRPEFWLPISREETLTREQIEGVVQAIQDKLPPDEHGNPVPRDKISGYLAVSDAELEQELTANGIPQQWTQRWIDPWSGPQ